MEFRLLGPLEVHGPSGPLTLGGTKQRGLLALLLLHLNEVVPAERLVESLWGERPPPTAMTALQGHVSSLRKRLEPDAGRRGGHEVLLTRAPGYVLRAPADRVDLPRFDALCRQGREALRDAEPERARELLEEALGLWRGPPLADLRYETFAQPEIARLEEARLAALEDRIEADLELGRQSVVAGELEALVAAHPLRERLRGQLMLALYRSGRQAEALAAYRETRRTLVEELGIEPSRELQQLERAILAQDRALDPPPARPARGATAAAPTAAVAPRAGASFVGRERELATLMAGVEAAFAGRASLVLLAGEAGIGKTRLADQATQGAAERGARVIWGRCWEAGGAPAYWPWVQALRAYARDVPDQPLRSQLGRGASDLAQLLPELRERFPDLPDAPSLDPEGARFRLFESTASFLRAAGSEQPLVVALDDIHAADPSSLLLLRFVARELVAARVLVIAAYRDDEVARRPPLGETLGELRREPLTRTVALEGLARDEVGRFVQSLTGATPSDRLVTAVQRETEGNPLFVGELVRLLLAEGRLDDIADSGWIAEVPRGLREVIGHRLHRLSEPCKRLLSTASVLGREFPLELLERLSGGGRDEMLPLLEEARDARVLTEIPGRRGVVRFSHALVRDALYGELAPAERLALHRRAARALEAVHRDDVEAHLAELAHHYLEAAPAGAVDEALEYALRAADRAASLLAHEEAARLYDMALQALDLRSAVDPHTRCDLLVSLGEAQARAGDLPAAKRTFLQAAGIARRLRSARHLARAALGYGGRWVWFRAGKDAELVPLLEDALAAQPPGDSRHRARLLARLAGALRDHPLPERREALCREAVAMARRLGDRATLAYALEGTYAARSWPRETATWLKTARELTHLAEQADEPEQLFAGHLALLAGHMLHGDIDAAESELRSMARIAELLRQPAQRWAMAVTRQMLATFRGDLETADRLLQEAEGIGERAQGLDATFHYVMTLQTWSLRRLQGRLVEVEDHVRRFTRDYPAMAIGHCIAASVNAELGRDAPARAALERLTAGELAALHVGTEWFFGACLLAEVCASVGDRAQAQRLYTALEPYAAFNVYMHPETSLGAAERHLGLLAGTLEHWDAAAEHFERAAATNARMGAWPWEARTRESHADMLRLRGRPQDRRRAAELSRSAAAMYGRLGMEVWGRRAQSPV